MKQNKVFIIIGLAILVLEVYFISEFDDCYPTPEDVVMNYKSSDSVCKEIIQTVYDDDGATTFFTSTNDDLCSMVMRKKKIGWQKDRMLPLITSKNMSKYASVPFQNNVRRIKINESSFIIYGYTNSQQIYNSKINGIKPEVKEFNIHNVVYKLWYIISSTEIKLKPDGSTFDIEVTSD